MNLHAFHNTVRKLYNIEWAQLDFLSDAQKDNFFDNPPRFFISADDETAEKLWGVMFPKPPEAKAGVVVPFPSRWSPDVRVGGLPPMQERKHGCPPYQVDFEDLSGSAYPLKGSAADLPPRMYLVNSEGAKVKAANGSWTPGYYD